MGLRPVRVKSYLVLVLVLLITELKLLKQNKSGNTSEKDRRTTSYH